MKLGSPIYIILIIAFVFGAIALIINDFNVNYGYEAGNSSVAYADRYSNYTEGSFDLVTDQLQRIEEEEPGWKTFFQTLLVIPLAVLSLGKLIINSIPFLSFIIADIAGVLGVSEGGLKTSLSAILVLAVIAAIIIMLVKFFHRSTVV